MSRAYGSGEWWECPRCKTSIPEQHAHYHVAGRPRCVSVKTDLTLGPAGEVVATATVVDQGLAGGVAS